MDFTTEEALSVIKNIKKLSTEEILAILKQEREHILQRSSNGNFLHNEKLMRISHSIRMIEDDIESLQKMSQKILFYGVEFERNKNQKERKECKQS